MHFLAVSLASSLVALGGAIPTLTERSTNFCPGQSYLTGEVKCASGFIGCVAYEKASQTCNGSKRFNNDCSAIPELGSFFNCANGFKGCSTNRTICDNKSSPPTPDNCEAGSKWYVCASNGFTGCSDDPRVCDSPKEDSKPDLEGCRKGSSFYVCANNGFRGCSADPHICDQPKKPNCTVSITAPTASVIHEYITEPTPKKETTTSCSTPTVPTCTVSTPTPIKSTSCTTLSTTVTTPVEPSEPCSITTPPPCSTVTPVPVPQKNPRESTKDCPSKDPEPCPNTQEPSESDSSKCHCTDNCPVDIPIPQPPRGAYYVCANGFRGYSTDPHVCDTVDNHTQPECPKGTWYVKPKECSSGFVGCTGLDSGRFEELCKGGKQYQGFCPAGHGNYHNCANGFIGCTTDVGICDK